MTLNAKQTRFVQEYLLCLNATHAAIRAGYSVKTAESQGSRLLTHAEVRAEVDAAMARRSERVEVKQDDVLREIQAFAHSDPINAFCEDGTLKHLADMDPVMRRAIKSIEFEELFDGASGEKFVTGRIVKMTFWDKPKGLEMLGRHLKLFTDKVELEAGTSFADALKAARTRAGR